MSLSKILPDFPRTQHLAHKPNAHRSDLVASEEECKIIFESDNVELTTKVDGANVGICFYEGNPVIRNRNNILNKGKTGHLRTPAKLQFASIYNWAYENLEKFEKLNELAGFDVTLYAEWLYALHGIKYDKLPSYLIVFDLYDWEAEKYICPIRSRDLVTKAGFEFVPLLHKGKVPNWEVFDKFCQEQDPFSTTDRREGVYVKVSDGKYITRRFKIVRHDFIQGCHWSKTAIKRNKLIR